MVVEICPSTSELQSIEKDVACTVEGCDRTFLHQGSLRMHLIKSHRIVQNDADKDFLAKKSSKGENAVAVQYKCPASNCVYEKGAPRSFPSFKRLKEHFIKVHAEKKFSCEKCGQSFGFDRDRRRHEGHCGTLFRCMTCGCPYVSREALLTHCKRKSHMPPEDNTPRGTQSSKNGKAGSSAENGAKDIVLKNSGNSPSSTVSCSGTSSSMSKPQIIVLFQQVPVGAIGVPDKSKEDTTTSALFSKTKYRQIQPKPIVRQAVATSTVMIDGDTIDIKHEDLPAKQDAEMQTDIFGVINLSHTDKESVVLNRHIQRSQSETPKAKRYSSPKSRTNLLSPKSPRSRSKSVERSTTGIQTSMTLVKRRSAKTIQGTQTSGDYILKTAMASADIPIQYKTVGLQVTPPKFRIRPGRRKSLCSSETQTQDFVSPRKKRKRRLSDKGCGPTLVDPQNIDHITPSVPSTGSGNYVPEFVTSKNYVDSSSQVSSSMDTSTGTSDNIVENHTQTWLDLSSSTSTQTLQSFLEKSLQQQSEESFKAPCQHSGKNSLRSVQVATSPHVPKTLDYPVSDGASSVCVSHSGQLKGSQVASVPSGQPYSSGISGEGTSVGINRRDQLLGSMYRDEVTPAEGAASGPTIDTHVQTTGTASDFELLLQSSGIYVDTASSSSDIDTQTGGDLDFLDLIMNNMETQTVDFDLQALCLSDIQTQTLDLEELIDTNNVHTQTAGPERGSFLHSSISLNTASGEISQLLSCRDTVTICSEASIQVDAQASAETQTNVNLFYDLDQQLITAETQTSLCDTSLMDMQTQTPSFNTQGNMFDFSTTNTHTQTTFEELDEYLHAFD